MTPNHRHTAGFTPLAAAVAAGRPEVVGYLMAKGASTTQPVRVLSDGGERRSYPLHIALALGKYHTAAELIEAERMRGKSRSWDLRDGLPGQNQQTPLHLAAADNMPAMVALLLEAGASPAAAARYPQPQISVSLKDAVVCDGDTPLHVAARNGRLGCVNQMVSLPKDDWRRQLDGFGPDNRNAAGQTALHAAAWCGDSAVVWSLLAGGYDRQACDAVHQTPLDVALAASRCARDDGDVAAAQAHHQVAIALMSRWQRCQLAWR